MLLAQQLLWPPYWFRALKPRPEGEGADRGLNRCIRLGSMVRRGCWVSVVVPLCVVMPVLVASQSIVVPIVHDTCAVWGVTCNPPHPQLALDVFISYLIN